MKRLRCFLMAFLICSLNLMNYSAAAEVNEGFLKFINQFRRIAIADGITKQTFDEAFAGITEPYPTVVHAAKNQPEFKQDLYQYLETRLTQEHIDHGRMKKIELSKLLDKIEQRFGVDRNIILAIWGNETYYGENLKNPHLIKDAIRALATLAYSKGHYHKYGRTQLLATLHILQNKYIDRRDLKSSWAGAMGQTQFIPTSYLAYAVDMDGDGKCDIVDSIPDALGTTANLLAKNGWTKGEPWIYQITEETAHPFRGHNGRTKTMASWARFGFQPTNAKELPFSNEKATFHIIKGTHPIYILTTHNFRVLKAYNNSYLYTLSVSLLADALKKQN